MPNFYPNQVVLHLGEKWILLRPHTEHNPIGWWLRNLRNGDEGWNTPDTFEVIAFSVEDGEVTYA